MPIQNRPKKPMTLNEFARVFTTASNARRAALEARNRREMGSPKRASPKKPSPKKPSPKRPSMRRAMSMTQFRNVFKTASNARRPALYARNAAEYAARKPNMNANAGSTANAAKYKRISSANNAALRAFFKKATSGTRR